MLSVHVDNVQDVAVVQCEGRIVHSDAAYTLRNAVTLQTDALAVVLDLSGVEALEGGGLSMLVFLRQWARDRAASCDHVWQNVGKAGFRPPKTKPWVATEWKLHLQSLHRFGLGMA